MFITYALPPQSIFNGQYMWFETVLKNIYFLNSFVHIKMGILNFNNSILNDIYNYNSFQKCLIQMQTMKEKEVQSFLLKKDIPKSIDIN